MNNFRYNLAITPERPKTPGTFSHTLDTSHYTEAICAFINQNLVVIIKWDQLVIIFAQTPSRHVLEVVHMNRNEPVVAYDGLE